MMTLYSCLLIVCSMSLVYCSKSSSNKNNACRTFEGYLIVDKSEECFYIPDSGDNVTDIINRHVGSDVAETHEVTTEDGYILSIFRIPRRNPKGVVVLQHPLSCDSRLWLSQNDQSTALIFYNQGYDVWLPNNRGTLYAQRHVTLSPKDEKFWDFSFHEMGLYDHKAVFDYIVKRTGQKIIFIGHSMAGTSSLIYASLRPEEALKKVKVMVQLSPIAYMKHTVVPTKLAAESIHASKPFLKAVHSYSFIKYNSWYLKFARELAIDWLKVKKILIYLIDIFVGWTPNEYDPQYFDLMVEQFGGELSWKVFFHYAQIIEHGGRFQMYSYGPRENLKRYGSIRPPEYPLENITVPNYLVISKDDAVSTPKDDDRLLSKLPAQAKIYGDYRISGINHLDYHYGKHRIEWIYQPVINFLHTIGN